MSVDTDWLAHTYPPIVSACASEKEKQEGQELACMVRLEALCWPDEPDLPEVPPAVRQTLEGRATGARVAM